MDKVHLLLLLVGASVFVSGCTTIGTIPCASNDGCSDGQFCEFTGCGSAEGACMDVPEECYAVYEPECGCDGNTYSNDCYRRMSQVSFQYGGDCAKSQLELEASHMIDVQFSNTTDVSYKSSLVMLLNHMNMGEWVTDEILSGVNVPSDMFAAFETYGLSDDVMIGYASGYSNERAAYYDTFLVDPDSQVVVFGDQGEAFEYLKVTISSDKPAMAILDNGVHYVVVTGYDEDNVYVNDPAVGKASMVNTEFLASWSTDGSYSYDTPFPGRFGLIWF